MVLHIPHSSTTIPTQFRPQLAVTDGVLKSELQALTDRYTDELFVWPGAMSVVFPYSRLLVDVERFADDESEPMSAVGMGMVYTHTTRGERLRRELTDGERSDLSALYDDHHRLFHNAVQMQLDRDDAVLIVDCHSFPDTPLPMDASRQIPRPDFCIGLDRFHTPDRIVRTAASHLRNAGWNVGIDWPYSGAIVPMPYFHGDSRVSSIMIEVNRRLYMNEYTGEKNDHFEAVATQVRSLLGALQRAAP